MTDTAHLMQSVRKSFIFLYPVTFFIISSSLVQSVADNETDVTVPGYFITEKRYKIVDYIQFHSSHRDFIFGSKVQVSVYKTSVSVKLFYPLSCFLGIRIIMVFISVANVL